MEKLLEEYFKLKQQEDEIKKEKEALAKQIKEQMIDKAYKGEKYQATITEKLTYGYKDEIGIINYLKNNQNSKFIIETIDNKALNAELKKEGIINTDLNKASLIEKKLTEALSVSEVK